MTHRPRQWLFAITLIAPNAPLKERIDALSKFLSPKPGEITSITDQQIRDQGSQLKDPGKLFGTISVNPPKGHCFTVTTSKDKRDLEVCKPTKIKWYLSELDPMDRNVQWMIKTGPDDFGIPVSWPTPYVIARTMPFDSEFYKMNSTPVFFKSCVPSLGRSDGTLRKITLTQFNGTKWYIRFPDEDEPMKRDTPPPPAAEDDKKSSGEHGDKKEEKKEEKKPDEKHGEKKEEKKDSGHGEESKKSDSSKSEPVEDEKEVWTINTGRAFEMNVGNFISDGSMPPGKKDTCRYVYDYVPKDYSLGRIECHHTDQFLYFYAFLPCMKPIIPKEP